MAITKKTIKASSQMRRPARPTMAARSMNNPVARRPRSINAGTSITASARTRATRPQSNVALSQSQKVFANQLT